jgi:glyoxylase-like metal-dependent hydrolase (beta-lactamase superfamily II)
MQLYSIETGNAKFDGGAVFGAVPKVLWQKLYPADESNLINSSIRCLLIVDEDKKILIDTGIGDKQDEKFLKNFHLNGEDNLLKSLKNHGFYPEEITDIILTHLHFDHCGGATKWNSDKSGFELTFPNATIHVSKGQWEWANNPNKREVASFLKENIQSISESGKLNLLENEGNLFTNVDVRFFNGHTEAQLIPFINYHGKTIVYTADFLASASHIPLPYIPSYDIRPLVSMQEKENFYKEAVENEYIIFFEHDLYCECCTLHNTEKGVRVKDTFKLLKIIN